MKKIIIALSICFIFSVSIVGILLALSREMIYNNNSFLRVFPSHVMDQQDSYIELKYNSYYIAGTDRHHVYLGSYTSPLHMMVANTELTDTQRVQLKIKNIDKWRFSTVSVRVDSPYFYISDGVAPGLFRGKIGEWEADKFINDSIYFSTAEPLTTNSLVLRANSRLTHEDFLLKRSVIPELSRNAPDLLQKQIDGVFCTDGVFVHARQRHEFVYLYFYRNQFIVADTSLFLQYRANTIDTVTKAKIKVINNSADKSSGLANPSALVNRRACVWKNWLLVNSNLMSKNDSKEAFSKTSVMDVYDLRKNGAYKFSFRLYNHDGVPISAVDSNSDKIFVINGTKLLSYKPIDEYF